MTKPQTLPESLRDVLNEQELCWLAGEQTLLVGRTYVAQNKVTLVDAGSVWLDAKVSAEEEFDLHIYLLKDGDLDYKCNCPSGSMELFCAHCAAAALVWLSNEYDKTDSWAASPASLEKSSSSTITLTLRKHLTSINQSDLIDALIGWAEYDSDCAQRLLEIPSSLQLSGHEFMDVVEELGEEDQMDEMREMLAEWAK